MTLWPRSRSSRHIFGKHIDHVDRYENYGPTHGICGYFSGEIKVLSTMAPRNIQSVLTREKIFPRPQTHIKSVAPFLSKGVFTVHGEAWKNVRDLLRPQFTTRNLQDLVIFAKHVDIMFEAVPTIGDDGWTEEFSFLELLHFFTLDTTTELLFGTSVNSQRAAMDERCRCLSAGASTRDNRLSPTNVAKAFDCANEWASLRMRLGSAYWLCDSLQFRRACKTVHDFTDKVRCSATTHINIKLNIYPLVRYSSTKDVCSISCNRLFYTSVREGWSYRLICGFRHFVRRAPLPDSTRPCCCARYNSSHDFLVSESTSAKPCLPCSSSQ
jgi:hypothetical protein